MDKNGPIAIIFLLLYVSTTCNASLVFHLRKLIAEEANNSSATSGVPPIESPVSGPDMNTSSINAEKPQLEKENEPEKPHLEVQNEPEKPQLEEENDPEKPQLEDQNDPEKSQLEEQNDPEKPQLDEQNQPQTRNQSDTNVTSPIDPKGSNKHDNDTKTLGVPSPPAVEKNVSSVGGGNGKAKATVPMPDDNSSCDESISSCVKQGMLACIKASKDSGTKDVFLLVKNEGEITLKVNVKLPNSFENNLADVEVPKHTSKKIDISSSVGKSNKLIVSSGGGTCELLLAQSVSVDKIIQQLSLYSKQVTPVYAIYASFLITILLGAMWACCRLRKKNQQDEVPYQELEMGIPESASAANVGGSEGWDHDWDDDWEDEIAVKSPSGHQVRSVSADGLTSRSPPKREGWENGWED